MVAKLAISQLEASSMMILYSSAVSGYDHFDYSASMCQCQGCRIYCNSWGLWIHEL